MLPADLPQIVGGKYRLRDVLGAGGTGTVYSVEHTITGELLALKVMRSYAGASSDAIVRFKREARAVSKIRSQHVVRIFDADVAPELGGAPYLVMDLLEGSDLEDLAGDGPIDPEDVVEWLRQVALPLDKAHRLGIVHRDLKPENLFMTRLDDGTPLVKILDFGIAKIADESPGTTQSGQLFGTPLYMAPEQARGEPAKVGPATDLFALGHIAYRLLAGVAYRKGTSLAEILNEILHEPLRAPSEIGPSFGVEFDRWFIRACQPDPALRFASAREQVEALARALGVSAEPETTGPPSSVTSTRSGPGEVRNSQADSSGVGIMSLRPTALEENGAMAANSGAISTLPVQKDLPGTATARGNRWRLAFFAVLTLVAILLLFFGVSWRRTPPGSLASRTAACEVDTAGALVNSGAPGAAPGGSAAAAQILSATNPVLSDDQATVTTVSTHPATAEHETSRPAAMRTPPARPVFTRKSLDDDPLSDQR